MNTLKCLLSLLTGIGSFGALAQQDGLISVLDSGILSAEASDSSWVSTVARIDELDARADAKWRSLRSREEYDAWRTELQARMRTALGELPSRTPLQAQTVSVIEKEDYRVEKVLFQSLPGIYMTANLFLPKNTKAKCPAVVMSCGHSRLGKDCATYLRACLLLVQRGIAAFMFDPYEQGERVFHPDLRPTDAHNNIGVKAMLLGWSMPMLRIWDAMRAVDYIESRVEVDAGRIGYMGQSGGGTMTALMTALDDRLKATAPSCYLTNLRQLCRQLGPQDAEQNIFGQLSFGLNHAGYVLLPDTKVCLTGRLSDFFPYGGAMETGRVVADVAKMLGCSTHYAMNFAPGEHGWTESTMTASADWMAAWLCDRQDLLPLDMAAYRRLDFESVAKLELALGSDERGVVDGGSVFGLEGACSIHDVLRERKRRLAMKRKALSPDERSALVRKLAGIRPESIGELVPRVLRESETNSVRICRLAFVDPNGLARPAMVLTPLAADRDAEPVLMTGADGRKSFVADVAKALGEGRCVMLADAFACGEIRGPAVVNGAPSYFYGAEETPEEDVAVMLYLVGESLVGRRATDILAFADYLSKKTGRSSRLLATGSVAVAAAHAYAVRPALFSAVDVRTACPSWDAYIEADNGRGKLRFASCVNGAMAHYDWTDLLPRPSADPVPETAFWQAEIDRASRAGGGVVSVPAGEHLTGGLYLRDNVTLHIEKGCSLRGVTDPSAYPPNAIPNVEIPKPEAWRAIVTAIGVTNVAVTGEGEIFGDGTRFPSDAKVNRPRGLLFYRCKDVRLEGFKMRDAACWSLYLKECDGVVVRGYRADSHGNATCDGLDIDSRNVLVEDCVIDSGDDAICLKSDNPDFAVENVEVRNCRIASCCAAIKLGTGSHGAFRHIDIHDCKVVKSLRTWMDSACGSEHYRFLRNFDYPGCGPELTPITAIALESVDGAMLSDVKVRNVDIEETAVPIFIRLGARRNRKYRGEALPMSFGSDPGIEDVLIENVRALATSYVASSITGVPEFRVKGVTLRNIEISCPASGLPRESFLLPVPECEARKPGASMFDCQVLPAYGFYLRHADNVLFDCVTVKFRNGYEEREPVVAEDCRNFETRSCSFRAKRAAVPGTVVGRIGVVSDRAKLMESFRRFADERVDMVIVDGLVGGETSDAELVWLRTLRDRYFRGPDRREVVYRYSSPVSMRQQEILDANGNVAFRDHKGCPIAIVSSGIPKRTRDEFLEKTVKPHLRGRRVAHVVEEGGKRSETVEITR